MKIFNCLFTQALGGMEQSYLDYNDALSAHGHEVISILHKHTKILNEIKTKYHLNNNWSKHDPLALLQLALLVRKEAPDVIITHGNRAHYLMNLVKGKSKSVGISHGSFGHIIRSDHIITVSKDLQTRLIEKNSELKEITTYIPNLIHLEHTQKSKPVTHTIPTIGFIGRLDREKGVDVFINALKRLKDNKIALKAKIAGDGSERSQIESMIKAYQLENSVGLLGWIHDKQAFYDSIDMVCMPSTKEPFGIVALEALKFQKPLIISNLPGPMEIVARNVTALVVEPGDDIGLFNSIKQLIDQPDLAQRLVENGKERVSDFSFEKIATQINDVISKV